MIPQLGEIKKGKEIGYTGLASYFIWHACIDCGKQRWTGFSIKKNQVRRLHCPSCGHKAFTKSQPCAQRRRENSPNWKGGRKQFGGYIHIYLAPDDFFYPMADKQGYVREHRLVVAKALGRNLHSWEIIHHKHAKYPAGSVEDKQDNRYPENLQLVSDLGHKQITIMESRIEQLEKRVTLLEAENTLLKTQIDPRAKRVVE